MRTNGGSYVNRWISEGRFNPVSQGQIANVAGDFIDFQVTTAVPHIYILFKLSSNEYYMKQIWQKFLQVFTRRIRA